MRAESRRGQVTVEASTGDPKGPIPLASCPSLGLRGSLNNRGPGLGPGTRRRHRLARTSLSKPRVCNYRADDLTSPLLVGVKNSSVGTLGAPWGHPREWGRPGPRRLLTRD